MLNDLVDVLVDKHDEGGLDPDDQTAGFNIAVAKQENEPGTTQQIILLLEPMFSDKVHKDLMEEYKKTRNIDPTRKETNCDRVTRPLIRCLSLGGVLYLCAHRLHSSLALLIV